MATQKPISTISYNTEAFLKEKLDTWYQAHIIQSYQYICHKGEAGDKDHIHVRIEPNKRIDPMDLQEQLKEYQMGKEKPLGCRPFRPSKEEDWFLYAVHDEDYLKVKYKGGEKGEKLPYKWEDIKAPEDYDVEIAFIRAKQKLEHTGANIAHRMRQGENAMKLITEGENVYTVNAIMRALNFTEYEKLQKEFIELSRRHEQLLDLIDRAGYVVEVDEEDKLKLTKV